MKKIEIFINYNSGDEKLLEITEDQFMSHKINKTLNDLFKPVIFFTKDATFSGSNWRLLVYHEDKKDYTVQIQPNTKIENGVTYYAPGINQESMNSLYKFIETDINN